MTTIFTDKKYAAEMLTTGVTSIAVGFSNAAIHQNSCLRFPKCGYFYVLRTLQCDGLAYTRIHGRSVYRGGHSGV